MPLLYEEALKLAVEDRQRGVIEEIITDDAMFALMPFTQVADETYSYVREGELAEGAFVAPYEVLEESASTFVPVDTKIVRFAGQVDIDNFMDEVQSGLNPQTATQIAMKAKGMGRQFRKQVVQGNKTTNPLSFDGLRQLVVADRTLSAGVNGNAVSFSALDELLDTVPLGADALVMRRGTWRAIKALNRAFGGNTADMAQLKNFGTVPAYDGVPVIINEFLHDDEVQGTNTATSSIYAVRFNEADGVHGLFKGATAGLRMENIGLLQDRDATRYRLKWYAGMALKATHSLARLRGVTSI